MDERNTQFCERLVDHKELHKELHVVTYETLSSQSYAVQANVCNRCLCFIPIDKDKDKAKDNDNDNDNDNGNDNDDNNSISVSNAFSTVVLIGNTSKITFY